MKRFCLFSVCLFYTWNIWALEPIAIHGSTRMAYWASDRQLNDDQHLLSASLWTRGAAHFAPAWSFLFDGHADIEKPLVQSFATQQVKHRRGYLREAMLRYEYRKGEVRAGYQIFSWGRADRINPTDQLNPRDYRILTGEDNEQRFGVPALNWSHDLSTTRRLQLYLQKFRPSHLPSEQSEAAIPLLQTKSKPIEWAVKLDNTDESVDWSVSYFSGNEKSRMLGWDPYTHSPVRAHAPIEMLGVDFSTTQESWALRGELALIRIKHDQDLMRGRQNYISGIIGFDRNLGQGANVNFQYFFRRYQDRPDTSASIPIVISDLIDRANNQFYLWQDGLTLRYADKLWNDELDWEWVWIMHRKSKDMAIRPRLNYRWQDAWKISVGADFFHGKAQSFFGALRKNNTFFIELQRIF